MQCIYAITPSKLYYVQMHRYSTHSIYAILCAMPLRKLLQLRYTLWSYARLLTMCTLHCAMCLRKLLQLSYTLCNAATQITAPTLYHYTHKSLQQSCTLCSLSTQTAADGLYSTQCVYTTELPQISYCLCNV